MMAASGWRAALVATGLLLVAAAGEAALMAAVGLGGGCDEQSVLDEADALTRAYCADFPDAWTSHKSLRQWGTLLAPCAVVGVGVVAAVLARWLAGRAVGVAVLAGTWLLAVGWAFAGWTPVLVRVAL
jgi:hypothetical protein